MTDETRYHPPRHSIYVPTDEATSVWFFGYDGSIAHPAQAVTLLSVNGTERLLMESRQLRAGGAADDLRDTAETALARYYGEPALMPPAPERPPPPRSTTADVNQSSAQLMVTVEGRSVALEIAQSATLWAAAGIVPGAIVTVVGTLRSVPTRALNLAALAPNVQTVRGLDPLRPQGRAALDRANLRADVAGRP